MVLSQILNQYICGIFKHIYFCRNINPQPTKSFDQPHTENTKRRIYHGLSDSGEGDQDSDINRLASNVLEQYTTVTKQCYPLPWTWTWHLWYCDCWFHFEKRPNRVCLLRDSDNYGSKGPVCYVLLFYNKYSYGEL